MKKLSKKLAEIKGAKSPALMTHVVLGYPSLKESIELTKAMADAGASIIELQIPFSDPIADGPSIMYANEVGIEQGVNTRDSLRAMEELASSVDIPLLFMSYFNLLYSYPRGVEAFLKSAKSAGAEGLIVPDIPVDSKRDPYFKMALREDLCPIPLVSPLTNDARMKEIASVHTEGFVYCVSTTGTTGARKDLASGLSPYLRRVKKHFKQARAVGFGISKKAHIDKLKGNAEIAVVGSASIDLIRDENSKASRKKKITKFVKGLVN